MIDLGEQLLKQKGNFYVSKCPRDSDTAIRGHKDAESMPVKYIWPARSSLQGTMATLFLGANILGFGANVLLQQRRERRPSRRQWGVAAVAVAVVVWVWAVWWRRARARQQLSGSGSAVLRG